MKENEQPTANDISTKNLDMNSRIIQPPTTGEGVNTPRPEPPRRQTYQPQQVITDAPDQPLTPAGIKQPSTDQTDKSFIPTYAKSTIAEPPKDYVAGGIYVIAGIMMTPLIYFAYLLISIVIVYGVNVPISAPNKAFDIGYIIFVIASAFGGVMLFKQKRIGLIIAIIVASILFIYGIFSIVTTFGAAIMFVNASNIVKLQLFNLISLEILLPIIVVSYLLQQRVRNFVSR